MGLRQKKRQQILAIWRKNRIVKKVTLVFFNIIQFFLPSRKEINR